MSLAEQMVGIKAKTFLMSALFDYAKKYSFLSTKWPEVTNEIVTSAMKIFNPDEKRLEDQTQKFLQWLGFSPVDLDWDPERKILNIYIGTSRIWRDDPNTDQVSNVMMRSLIGAIGANFFGGVQPHVEFLQQNLPPRTSFGFRITESIGDETFEFGKETLDKAPTQESVDLRDTTGEPKPEITTQTSGPTSSSITKAIKRLIIYIDPLVGSGVNKEDVAKELFEACSKLLEKNFPDEYRQMYQDIGSYNVIQVLFQKASAAGNVDELVKELADSFSASVKETYPSATPNEALTGIGKLDPSTLDELLFYTKESHVSHDLCKFISNVWLGYINQFMPTEFNADDPMCKITATFCLYAFTPK